MTTGDHVLRLLIVRHGETDLNRTHRMQGRTDEPLNAEGRRQLARTAERLSREPVDLLVTSDFRRAVQSAEIIGERLGLVPQRDPRLREQDLGEWEGLDWFEIPRLFSPEAVGRFIGDLDFAPPGGETKRSVRERMRSFLAGLRERPRTGTVVAVTHGGPIMVLLYDVLGIPFGPRNLFYARNGGLTELARAPDEEHFRLVTFDETFFLRESPPPD